MEQGGWLGGTVGFFEGLGSSIKDLVEFAASVQPQTMIANALAHPEATWQKAKSIFHALEHPVDTAHNLWNDAKVIWSSVSNSFEKDIIHGNAYTRSRWAGYAVGTIAATLLTDGGGAAADAADAVSLGAKSFDAVADNVLSKYGTTREEFNALRNKQLTEPGMLDQSQQDLIKAVRGSVTLDSKTLMSKVVSQKEMMRYIQGEFKGVRGFVTRAQDTEQLKTPLDFEKQLRLDYNSPKHPYPEYYDSNPKYQNPFLDEGGEFKNEPIGILRFTARNPENYGVPYEFNDVEKLKSEYPFTGSGFTGGDSVMLPEFKMKEVLPLKKGDCFYLRYPDGQEEEYATFNGRKWVINQSPLNGGK